MLLTASHDHQLDLLCHRRRRLALRNFAPRRDPDQIHCSSLRLPAPFGSAAAYDVGPSNARRPIALWKALMKASAIGVSAPTRGERPSC